jgi:hypothetical protein
LDCFLRSAVANGLLWTLQTIVSFSASSFFLDAFRRQERGGGGDRPRAEDGRNDEGIALAVDGGPVSAGDSAELRFDSAELSGPPTVESQAGEVDVLQAALGTSERGTKLRVYHN